MFFKDDSNDKYVVLQVVLTEKLFGTGSGITSLSNLPNPAVKPPSFSYGDIRHSQKI